MFERADDVIFQVTRLDVFLFIIFFAILMSVISVCMVYFDKTFAKKEMRRISEKSLFIVGFLGGALAEYIAMQHFRHKTLHKRFMIGLPIIFIVQIGFFIYWTTIWF